MAAAPAATIPRAYQRKYGPQIAPCCWCLAPRYARLSTRTLTRTAINTAAINSHVSSLHLPTSRLPPRMHLAPRICQLAPCSYQLAPHNSRPVTSVWNPRENRDALSSMDPYQTVPTQISKLASRISRPAPRTSRTSLATCISPLPKLKPKLEYSHMLGTSRLAATGTHLAHPPYPPLAPRRYQYPNHRKNISTHIATHRYLAPRTS
jgi:hypothetical protein